MAQAAIIGQIVQAAAKTDQGIASLIQARREEKLLTELGRQQRTEARITGRRLQGAQRAAFGASGVDVGSGTPLDVTAATAFETELEAIRRKFAFDYAAYQRKQEGRAALFAGLTGGTGTILGGMGSGSFGGFGGGGGMRAGTAGDFGAGFGRSASGLA